MNFQILIIILLTVSFTVNVFFEILRFNNLKKEIPEKAYELYNINDYDKSIKYTKTKIIARTIESSIVFVVSLVLLLGNVFNSVYTFIENNINLDDVYINIIMLLFIAIIYMIINAFFDWYFTFKIEEEYGFNKTSPKRFVLDLIIKFSFVVVLVVALTLFLDEFFKTSFDEDVSWKAFLYIVVAVFMMWLVDKMLNKLTPIPEGTLKDKIEEFCNKHNFKFKNVYVVDASKRSTKVNAYFKGFWFFRKIVLYDTLLEKFTEDEIMSVFAHEVAHAKNKDTLKRFPLVYAVLMGGAFLTHYLYDVKAFYESFNFIEPNTAIIIFSVFVTFDFFSLLLKLIVNPLSRRAEYRADRFAANEIGKDIFISLEKRLIKSNFSDINPHPIDVFVNRTHPTPIQRIEAVERLDI